MDNLDHSYGIFVFDCCVVVLVEHGSFDDLIGHADFVCYDFEFDYSCADAADLCCQ